MRILVVADTWGARVPLRSTIEYEKCDRIIFLGDYVSDLESLGVKGFPPFVVRGECDSFHNRPFEIMTTICGFTFYMVNGYLQNVKQEGLKKLQAFADERPFDVVLYGCTKRPKAEMYNDKTLFLTPGSFGRPEKGERCNYAIITVDENHFDYEFKQYELDRFYEQHEESIWKKRKW